VSDDKHSFDEKQAPKVEVQTLSSSFRYEFLSSKSTQPIIFNVSLSASQIDSLLGVLRLHRKDIGYIFDDLKEIHPFV